MALKCFSQEKTVAGIVFDKDSKDRIASVNVHNITTGIAVFNNLKGEFTIKAKEGDQLVFTKQAYHPDTVKVQNNSPLAIYMARLAIQLKEVTVHDSLRTPEERLEATKRDYNKVYGSLAYGDFLTNPSGGGAGLSIDALYNAISREGRNASRLRQIIQNDYEQNVIDYRFNRIFVGHITGLKDEGLTAFMSRYRPGYYTTKTMSDYEFVSMIRNNLRRFLRRNQAVYYLPPLAGK
jgi:co-chaperonin GroES (HSP10)